ncbi:KH domain protein [Ancylostoma caninum]|uniref:KH domain protein n=1 Tax=Ancylostoma caninum TaxID=29170 RepID=A0A368FYA6_ANCCA|nr:KH domain protein [Ancylostoma caninum]
MADHDSHNDEGNPLSVIHSAGTKRTQDSYDGPASKRAHVDGDDNNLAVKILIPSAAVGAIIGKGGEAMRNLKNDHQCRVQMSKSSETYPGTSERICLVKGRVQNVIGVIDVILQKIREKCEGSTSSDAFDHKGVSRGNEVKIVMPNTSAGMVIGKSGANIKDIRETYGCQIQVFPKAGSTEAQNSLERIVTLAHEDHSQLIQATARVLEKVVADPHHTSEINKEDFGNKSGGARVNILLSPIAIFFSAFSNGGATSTFSGGSTAFGSQPYGYTAAQQPTIKFNPMSGLGNQERGFGRVQTSFGRGPTNTGQPRMPQHGRDRMSGVEGDQATLLSFLDNLQSTLRSSGFNEASVAEVMQAMQVLAKYNIMGLGLGLGVAAMAQMRSAQETTPQMPSNHGVAGFGDQGGYASGDQVGRFQSQGVQIRWQ